MIPDSPTEFRSRRARGGWRLAARLMIAGVLSATGAGSGRAVAAPDSPTVVPAADAGAVVGADLLAALAGPERPRVVIYFEPEESAPQGAQRETAIATERRRFAIAGAQDRLLAAAGVDGFTLRRRFNNVPALAGEITAKGLERLRRQPGVRRIDLERPGSADLAQSVPLVRADLVRALGITGEGITVGIIDTGIDTDHPDLADDLTAQACLCLANGGCCPNGGTSQFGPGAAEDDNGHGTHVAGIITSKGQVSAIGVAPDARIVAVKVLDLNGHTCCMSDVIAGLDWILDNHPEVGAINISIGSSALYGGDCDNADATNQGLAAAIGALRAAGVPVFVSAGNSASGSSMSSPACIAAAVSVGAVYDANIGGVGFGICSDLTTAADKVSCYSNSNASTDLFAPGGAITATWRGGGTATLFGTSMAAPHAAACAALLKQDDPGIGAEAIEAALEATGKPVTDPKNMLTFPRIDCLAALQTRNCTDADGDGFWAAAPPACPGPPFSDCDDNDPARFPGNTEVCDQRDNDCDGLVDEGQDPDSDGRVSCLDNCPADANPGQSDRDHDGQGDACDLDDGVIEVTLPDNQQITWQREVPYATFNIYRGDVEALADANGDGAAEDYGSCLAEALDEPVYYDNSVPPIGHGYIYLITANGPGGEGSLGPASSGVLRPNPRDCRAIFGSPPAIAGLSTSVTAQSVSCDVTLFSLARLCLYGVPGAQAAAPMIIQGTYTEARLLAQVTDPESTPQQSDLVEVRATLQAASGGSADILMFDDGSQTVIPEMQRVSDAGEDCPATPGACGCPLKIYPLESGDATAADATSTRVFGIVSAALPALVQDCIMQTHRQYPLLAAPGAQFEVHLTATDRAAHVTAWPQFPPLTAGAGSYSCSGDACGCCLLIAGDPVTQCAGLPGIVSPDYPAGVCMSF